MSVPKSRRTKSKLDAYHNAVKLRKDLTLVLLRDFGVRDKVRKPSSFTKDMSEEDRNIFNTIAEKYDKSFVLEEYPSWMIDHLRCNILTISRDLVYNITHANSIYPIYESEFYERRNYQDRAIGNCETLLIELQYAIEILPMNVNNLLIYIDAIEEELATLKGWKKGDNKILKRILQENNKSEDKDLICKTETPQIKDNKDETPTTDDCGRATSEKSASNFANVNNNGNSNNNGAANSNGVRPIS